MAISKEIKLIAAKYLVEDVKSHSEIAEELNISKKSVQRINRDIKKELGAVGTTPAADLYHLNDNPILKKIQETQQRKKEIARLYEDTEEGWIFNISKNEIKAIGSGRWWTFIVYPESAPADWKDQLRNLHLEIAISPLHDRDRWLHDSPPIVDEETGEVIEEAGTRYKCGDLKKIHWHVLIKTDKPVGFKEICKAVQDITQGPIPQKVRSLRGTYEYLAHLNEDHTKKALYDYNAIERYNGFVLEPTKTDAARMLVDVFDTIAANQFINLSQVIDYYRDMPEYIIVIGTKAYAIQKGLDAEWRRQNPDGPLTRVKIED